MNDQPPSEPRLKKLYPLMNYVKGDKYCHHKYRLLVVGHSFYLDQAEIPADDWYCETITKISQDYIDLEKNLEIGSTDGGKWPNHPIYRHINDMLNKAMHVSQGFGFDHVAYCNYFYRPGACKSGLRGVVKKDREVATECLRYTMSACNPNLVIFATANKRQVVNDARKTLCEAGFDSKHVLFTRSPSRGGRKRFEEESLRFLQCHNWS